MSQLITKFIADNAIIGSKTRVTFAGGLALAGASALAAGETIQIKYEAFGP